MEWRSVADMAIGIAVPVAAAVLFVAGRFRAREILFLIWGFLIGAAFEFFIGFQGPVFFTVKMHWPLPMGTYYLCHSLWDGGLFMAGIALAGLLLRKPFMSVCRAFNWKELAVMTVWGAGTAFVVEMIGNGVIWEYHPMKWNPVWITVRGQGYTAFIQIVWLVAPFVFYMGCIGINRIAGERGRM